MARQRAHRRAVLPMGDMFAVGGFDCSCNTTGCGGAGSPTFSGTVKGCNTIGARGITVTAHDSTSTGTVLGSTTTGSSGTYSLTGLSGEVVGNAIVLVFSDSSGRFANSTVSLAYTAGTPGSTQWSCGKTTTVANITLTVNSGYTCPFSATCAYPWQDTPVLLSDSYTGINATLTWNAGLGYWESGNYAYSRGTTGGCASVAMTLYYVWDDYVIVYFEYNSAPGTWYTTQSATGGASPCFIPGVSAFNWTSVNAANWDYSGSGPTTPYCGQATTFTVTE